MKTIFVVYRESDAQNIAAFPTYDLANDYIDTLPESDDHFIDEVAFHEIIDFRGEMVKILLQIGYTEPNAREAVEKLMSAK